MNVKYEVLTNSDIKLLKDVIEDNNKKYCPEHVKKFIETKGNIGFIVKLEGKVIGLTYCYSLFDLDGRMMMYIYFICIHSEHRNKGYGSSLINFVIEYSKNNNYSECFLYTNKKMLVPYRYKS